MTTRRRDMAHGTMPQDVLLLHPESLETHPCRVVVSRRGLLLQRLPDRPSRSSRHGSFLRVPWWTVQGFSADEVETAPDGTTMQVVEVVTDAGTLSLMVRAPEVSVLLSRVGRWSNQWGRSRRAPTATIARAAVIVGAWLRPVAAPFKAAGAWAGSVGLTAILWTIIVLRAAGRAFWRPLAATTKPAVRLLSAAARPVGRLIAAATRAVLTVLSAVARPVLGLLAAAVRPAVRVVARVTAPARRWWAESAAGIAAASAWRRGRETSAQLFGTDGSSPRLRPALAITLALSLLALTGYAVTGGGAPDAGLPHAGASPIVGTKTFDGMSHFLKQVENGHGRLNLPKASAPPAPAPPSLANEPPLSSHEVFGFAPYWTLTQSTGFDVTGMTTIAYFSIGVNPNGTLAESGSGWDGYQSQDLANLVTRAHAAGVRVVLTVNCFDQNALDQLTSSPTAPTTLSNALLQAVEAKNLDGVNLDFEGAGSADQVGLTNLVTKVSAALHGANPHYQVTMDTYASSAGDSGGFYNIPALAPVVDGFFVMAYQLNLRGSSTAASPLTSSMFSDLTTAQQYAAAVAPGKVIMGLPYYGYNWPTNNGTMAAQATGGATPITYGQVVGGGYPTYWDPVTDTAWTSYQVGGQWYEDYYEDPQSLYMATQLSQSFGLAGVGIWALGMDGNNAQMLAALDGNAPVTKQGAAGPASTSASASGATAGASAGASGTGTAGNGATTTAPGSPTTAPGGGGGGTTTTTAPPTTTTTPSGGGGGTGGGGGGGTGGGGTSGPTYQYTGTWQAQPVTLTLLPTTKPKTAATAKLVGQLTGFHTTDPTRSCLSSAASLSVWKIGTAATTYEVVAVHTPKQATTDCVTAVFTFPIPGPTSHLTKGTAGTGGTTTTTTTAPVVVTSVSGGAVSRAPTATA
jgi:spore germination protein YaaH